MGNKPTIHATNCLSFADGWTMGEKDIIGGEYLVLLDQILSDS